MTMMHEHALDLDSPSQSNRSGLADYRICRRCVMDTTDEDIRFDEDGVCNHCHSYDRDARARLLSGSRARVALDELLSDIRRHGRGKPYDCVIGVSGGVDSTYVAYLSRQLGLRPLAVHLDNGWNSELAVANIANTLKALDIDLYTHVIDWEEFRSIHLAFLRAGVINSEIPTDHAILATLYHVAANQGIRYVLSGSNTSTEGVLPYSWVYNNKDLRHIRAICRRFGVRKFRTFPTMGLVKYLYYTLVHGVREIPLLNYVKYDKAAAKQTIATELQWRDYGGKHFESVYTAFYQAYILPHKFGVDKRRAHLSSLVANGQLSRESALRELATAALPLSKVAEYETFVAKKLGMSLDAFRALMRQSPVSHLAYPNNAWLYRQLVKIQQITRRNHRSTAHDVNASIVVSAE